LCPARGPTGHVTTQDTASTDTADLELAPISTASSEAQLQEIMDVARLAANAQRDLEAEGLDPLSEAEDETPEHPEPDTEQPAQESPEVEIPDESAATTEEPEEEAEEPEEGEQSEAEPKQPETRSERRQRALQRVQDELKAARAELQQARAVAQQHQASDASIIRAITEQAGSEQEYANLTHKNNMGRATDEERQRLSIMAQWRQVAGPIYRTAQQQVVASWGNAFRATGDFDGMTEETHQQVMAAADPQKALELIHTAGLRAGEERARAEAQAEAKKVAAENARLKAEISSLKTKVVVSKPQPATPDGTSPAAGPKLPPMLLADGTLNPEFEKLASSGKLYGVEHLAG
jgi:hypothetical protein